MAATTHRHGAGCGHTAIEHEGHVDYLQEGHLQHQEGRRLDEHVIAVSATNPDACTPKHKCDGHLHHPHGDHCDAHGPVRVKA